MSESKIPIAVLRLGRISTTSNVLASVSHDDIVLAIGRHQAGDWGEMGDEDRIANDHALASGGRILSAYRAVNGIRFWVLTEGDRSHTTVMLPEDY